MILFAFAMRLLLVFLALLSGLSLSDVAVASSRAEVVGSASGTVLVARHEAKSSASLAKPHHPSGETRAAPAGLLAIPAPIHAISITIPDRPRE